MSSNVIISSHVHRMKLPSPQKNSSFKICTLTPTERYALPLCNLSNPPPKLDFSSLPRKKDMRASSPSSKEPHTTSSLPALEETATPLLPHTLRNSRHIVLDGFPLIMNKVGPPMMPATEQIEIVKQIFDGVFEVSVNASFMIVRCRTLPAKPWPITFGGIPLWLTDSIDDTPMIEGKPGRTFPVLPHMYLSRKESPSGADFALIAKYFLDELSIVVSEIMWNGPSLRLRLQSTVPDINLPAKIGGLVAFYGDSSAIPDYQEAARRLISPSTTIRDDTCYLPNLRPGVILSCGRQGGEELFTSSGVIVKDEAGQTWMTVASDGFPLGNETVHHPNANYPMIGTVEKIIGETDISLVKLYKGYNYTPQTFASELKEAINITSLRRPTGLRTGDILSMENAFSGYCEGTFVDTIWKSIPEGEGLRSQPWVIISSFYLGNGLEEPLEGSCGTPVLTDEGEVVGLFRFLTASGKAYCVSPEALIDMGLQLGKVSGF